MEFAAPEQTRSREETESYENIDVIYAETERSFTSISADATVSSTEANPTMHSSWNEPIASTSEWKTSPVSPGKSRKKRPSFKVIPLFCGTKFWKKRSSDNKTIASMFKRSVGRKKLPSTAAAYDSAVKITQIEPSTVQTAREGNERRAYVNVQVQTPDAIVTRILSEFLLSGEKKKRVLMSIILQSDDSTEVETQTSSNDTSVGINMFGYSDKRPQDRPAAIATMSKSVQCFVCEEQNYYEMRQRSDNSITSEEPLIACSET